MNRGASSTKSSRLVTVSGSERRIWFAGDWRILAVPTRAEHVQGLAEAVHHPQPGDLEETSPEGPEVSLDVATACCVRPVGHEARA